MVQAIFLRKLSKFMVKLSAMAAFCAVCGLTPVLAPAEALAKPEDKSQRIGRSTGLPLPRFASVKANPARLRRGPGQTYPIIWELTRSGLPVRIVAEYGHWRRVELHDGTRGWMHRVLLSGRRTALLLGADREIRAEPDPHAPAAAKVAEATPMKLQECARGWCALEASGARGWAPRERIWGADARLSAREPNTRD